MSEMNLLVLLRAKAGREAALRKNLTALVAPSRKEAGNICYDLFVDTQDKRRFVFVETWASSEAQKMHHNESEHIRHFHDHGDEDVESRELVLVLERLA